MNHQCQVGAWLAGADDIVGLGAIQAQCQPSSAGLELQRQHAHADQVGAMDTFEAFGNNRFHACQTHALGGPVARRTLAVIGAGDDDQRLFAAHIGFDCFPHAHHFAFRLDTRQRTGFYLAFGIAHHFVFQRRVGKRRALRGQVVAAVGGVRVEVLFRQAHLVQILASGRVHHDGVRRRQVIGGDVVWQYCQRAHAGQRAWCCQRAFPVRWATDVGRHRAPVVQRADLGACIGLHRKHRLVHLAELLRLDAGFDDGVDFLVARPNIFQADFLAVDHRQHILFDIETNGAGNRVGYHQRRRSEESLFRIRVDTAVEVTITR